ncbi:aminopeptidase N [Pseudomarimonas arenosa]|uniref:Aminopeptidase N n=1 Tax=Pseudomarimonas arenosa TaxID=2774145 RepID=A0AAW3ZRH9_9GAMM|nr:aminopeptidase N [Pseudomarimonas arenosa]MBD8526851.1 aminopeptidase N [Pseudomarimonas arenosa]
MSVVRLADYRRPSWRIHEIDLCLDLEASQTRVRCRMQLEAAEPDASDHAALCLQGEELQTESIRVDDRLLAAGEYSIVGNRLHIERLPARCVVETVVLICPQRNTRLEGLYASGPMLLTQCEAEGFRRITWALDRPDVLSRYRVELRAEKSRYPVLLSNGNREAAGDLKDGRHFVRWFDPHPKPGYLFAIVAGDIGCVETRFVTIEGRQVDVRVWTEHADVARCQYALEATLRAMRWDEERFGRAYDLDEFNIVAVQYFTMGAMENKGLNIFNARYILADADSATDADYEAIEAVIGHEYFHNWSGNRVTLRDWFQLSLKEGLTVFRDQEFTADLRSRGVKRIGDVRLLRARQFVEDSGPLAHPVRPIEYSEINNFYTATVYEKGAEVIRMLHTLLGETDFRRGLDRYFAAHDGQAATVEDFLAAMSAASGRNLEQFKRWYEQAGTPEIQVSEQFDPDRHEYVLTLHQHLPPTPGGGIKQPLHLPLRFAFYNEAGQRIDNGVSSDAELQGDLIELREPTHRLQVSGLGEAPLPTFLHSLSAPVRLKFSYRAEQLAKVVRFESDPLLRWDAIQRLAFGCIAEGKADYRQALLDACGELLASADADHAFVAECLSLPDITTLADQCAEIDLDGLIKEREDLLDELAEVHADALDTRYRALATQQPDSLSPEAAAARRLKNVLLHWLTRLDPTARLAERQSTEAPTMTDRIAALAALVHFDAPGKAQALDRFAARWHNDLLVTDKWIGLVATRPQPEALDDIAALLRDPQRWLPNNPNRVRAVLGTLGRSNPVAFHRRDGAGYRLYLEQVVQLDAINPQVSARLLTALESWRRLDAERQGLIKSALTDLQSKAQSADLKDVVGRLLA